MEADRTFIPDREMSFDKGDVPSRLQYNPVRHYNTSKPEQYQIEFFIPTNTSGEHNFIHHIGGYQGKNVNNISIPPDLWKLIATQKQ